MATPRNEETQSPYLQFNFTVELGNGITGGFQEVSGVGMEVAITEYRNGTDKTNNVRKLNGLNKATDVTFKRGIFGTTALYVWIDQVRTGKPEGVRNVKINLMSEDRSNTTPVLTWSLNNARIIKYTSGPFSAKGNDVAMEELVLAYERLEVS